MDCHPDAAAAMKRQASGAIAKGSPDQPSVAVLLSTYNGATYLQEQLESLRAQERVRVCLHARDDGSSDLTCEILRQYAGVWPALADTSPGQNLGPAASFLQLLRTAPDDADYYAFCDQDDVWLPEKLARAAAALASETGPALYCSNVICVADDLRVLGVPPAHDGPGFEHLLFENVGAGCTVVLNPAARALINSEVPLRGVVMHDWWCVLVVAMFGHVHYDPEPSIFYRQHGANALGLQANWGAQKVRQVFRLFRERHAFYPIHAQATELLSLYGDRMQAAHRNRLERLVASKRSWLTRAAYAMSGDIVHRRFLDAAALRGLTLVGWY
jgi:glycosyltransferase involved in cell wall biosynthesis